MQSRVHAKQGGLRKADLEHGKAEQGESTGGRQKADCAESAHHGEVLEEVIALGEQLAAQPQPQRTLRLGLWRPPACSIGMRSA